MDGRKDTRWLSQGMSDNEFLELDLGGVERVCAVRLEWGIATALRCVYFVGLFFGIDMFLYERRCVARK